MSIANLVNWAEPIHQTVEQYPKKHMEKQTNQNNNNNNNNKQIFPNYPGHHMKGSYQKAKTHGKRNNSNNKKNKDFQTSLAEVKPSAD